MIHFDIDTTMKENHLYHIYNRGNWKAKIFLDQDDYLSFQKILRLCFNIYHFDLLIVCIMPNHYHLVVNQRDGQNISKCMHRISIIYTKHFNQKYKTVGHTFQGSFNAKRILDLDYFHKVITYIKTNPMEAELVKSVSEKYAYTYINEMLISYYDIFFEQKLNGERRQRLIILSSPKQKTQ